jgi:hypothetical protein
MCDNTAEHLVRMQDSLDRIEDLLSGLAEPAPPLRIDGREQTRGQADHRLPPRLAEVIPIDTARR